MHLWVLKGILEVCFEFRLTDIPSFMAATCILHNICKASGDTF